MSPSEQVESTLEDVIDLIDEGTLTGTKAEGLVGKLNQIQRMIADGRPVQSIVGQLNAFINEVESFMNADPPVLSPAQGQPLIDAAQTLIIELTG